MDQVGRKPGHQNRDREDEQISQLRRRIRPRDWVTEKEALRHLDVLHRALFTQNPDLLARSQAVRSSGSQQSALSGGADVPAVDICASEG